jgi:hypothetical protein
MAPRGCARIDGMIPRRRYVALLLVLVVFGWVASLVRGSSGAGGSAAPTPTPTLTPTATAPAATAPAGVARDVTAALDRVQRAFDAGDVRLLCRPGALVDPDVIRQQDSQSGGCEAEAETLIGDEPRMQLDVRSVAGDGDLATATVKTAGGATVRVDLIRTDGRWLLSFMDAGDPLPALAGVA